MNEEILKRIDVLAAKMGVASEQLWAALIRQAHIEGVFDMWTLCSASVVTVLSLVYFYLIRDDYGAYLGRVFSTIFAIVCFVIWCACGGDILAALHNPEYWAANRILSALR